MKKSEKNIFIEYSEDVKEIRSNLKKKGFYILRSQLRQDECNYIKAFIDYYAGEDAEINYGGSEKRIWDSQVKDHKIEDFAKFSNKILSEVFNKAIKSKTILSYSNHPVAQKENLIAGRWHLDSLLSQYKLFCFLTETKELTGPLELVPGTHKAKFKFLSLLAGKYFALSDIITGKRRYQSLNDAWIQKQCLKRGGSIPFICNAGTLVLVDTSAIHRARPCIEGQRYALCAYYEHF
jgi:ectoine hydroxylase-related dioxygenase (phytanoyl-CoA dioxygenase family)